MENETEEEKETAAKAFTEAGKRAEAEAKLRDVTKYALPEELEARLANYSFEDPVFADHVKRAHKYFSAPDARGEAPWKIEVKLLDPDSGEFNKFGPMHRETIPTPDELREENAFGKLRFVLHYYTPYKTVKGGVTRKGIITVRSKAFDIEPPVLQGRVVPASGGYPGQIPQMPQIGLPPAPMVDAFQSMLAQIQQMSTQAQAMVMQAANSQMEILANRAQIVNEGVEKGRLAQQVEERDKRILEMAAENARLQKERQQANAQIMALATQDDEPTSDSGIHEWLQPILERYVPAALKKFGIELPEAAPGSDESGPVIPPQS